jgi:hypothetical protein
VEGVAQGRLLGDPLGVVARRAATGDDGETLFGQTLANAGSDATHAARDVSYFLSHVFCSYIEK